jgi:hypothetical protein
MLRTIRGDQRKRIFTIAVTNQRIFNRVRGHIFMSFCINWKCVHLMLSLRCVQCVAYSHVPLVVIDATCSIINYLFMWKHPKGNKTKCNFAALMIRYTNEYTNLICTSQKTFYIVLLRRKTNRSSNLQQFSCSLTYFVNI